MKPKNIKHLQSESRHLNVHMVDKHTFVVESTTSSTANHVVTVEFGPDGQTVHARCTCAWAIHNGVACVHVMAALEYLANYKERTLSFWTSQEDARRQKHRVFRLTNGKDGVWITSRNEPMPEHENGNGHKAG